MLKAPLDAFDIDWYMQHHEAHPALTAVKHNQTFYTWLVAKNSATGDYKFYYADNKPLIIIRTTLKSVSMIIIIIDVIVIKITVVNNISNSFDNEMITILAHILLY